MSRISDKFEELKQKRQKALIAYITAGDPSLKSSERFVSALERGGADIIELGVPFSDPLADGPTIQASHMRALMNDVGVADVLKLVKKIRKNSGIPLVLMMSYNLISRYGVDRFISDASSAGVDGVISPDLPYDEAAGLVKKSGGLDLIFLVAPTSTDDRIDAIVKGCSGFVYLVSLAGITGARGSLPSDIKDNVVRIKKRSKLPVAVGFGISSAAHVREVCGVADGAIVGSAIVKIIEQNRKIGPACKKIKDFVSALKRATDVQ